MKVLVVLFLAIASACAFSVKSDENFIDMEPVIPDFDPESRITNGKPGAIANFPYQVGLAAGKSWCGGSLISINYVLTAAHCVDGTSASNVVAYMGSATRQGGTSRTARAIKIHSGWNRNTFENDIALLAIDAVTLGTNIRTVPLPPVGDTYTFAGLEVIASGWGKTSDTSGVSNSLQYAELTVITNTECAYTYGADIRASNICVATPGGTSPCNGDSGGPLVLSGSRVQVGLVSFGASAGCTKGYPGVFTRITTYRKWIKDYSGV